MYELGRGFRLWYWEVGLDLGRLGWSKYRAKSLKVRSKEG